MKTRLAATTTLLLVFAFAVPAGAQTTTCYQYFSGGVWVTHCDRDPESPPARSIPSDAILKAIGPDARLQAQRNLRIMELGQRCNAGDQASCDRLDQLLH